MPDAQNRSDLLRRLQELESVEANADMMQAFRDSLHQIKDVLNDQANDAEAAAAKIDEIKDTFDKFGQVIQGAKDALEIQALDGVIEVASGAAEAGGRIKDGVGQFGEKSKAVAENVAKLSEMLDEIDNIDNLGGEDAAELISKLGKMIAGLTDLLGPLIDLVPILGPFLEMYTQAIEIIAKDVKTITTAMTRQNQILRELGFGPAYTFTGSGAAERKKEIADITAELNEIGWSDPPNETETPPSAEERRANIDASNAFDLGIRNCGCGEGASSPQAGWHQARRRLDAARQQLALADQRAGEVEHLADAMPVLEKENEQAAAALTSAEEKLQAATDTYEEASRAGHSSGTEILEALEGRDAARDDRDAARADLTGTEGQLDRFDSARDDLEKANAEYDEAYEAVKSCFDQMDHELPDGVNFVLARSKLVDWFSPHTGFEERLLPRAERRLETFRAVPRSTPPVPAANEPNEKGRRNPLMLVGGGLMVVFFIAMMFALVTGGGGSDSVDAATTAGDELDGDRDGDSKNDADSEDDDDFAGGDGDSKYEGEPDDGKPKRDKPPVIGGPGDLPRKSTLTGDIAFTVTLGEPHGSDSSIAGEMTVTVSKAGAITALLPLTLLPPAKGFAGLAMEAVGPNGVATYNECGHSTDRGTSACNQWAAEGYQNCASLDIEPSTPGEEWQLETVMTMSMGLPTVLLTLEFDPEAVESNDSCPVADAPSVVGDTWFVFVDFETNTTASAMLDIKGALAGG